MVYPAALQQVPQMQIPAVCLLWELIVTLVESTVTAIVPAAKAMAPMTGSWVWAAPPMTLCKTAPKVTYRLDIGSALVQTASEEDAEGTASITSPAGRHFWLDSA